MLFTELKKHIGGGKLLPAYLVTGDDSFLVSSSINMFKAVADEPKDFNLVFLEENYNVQSIYESCMSLSFGGGKRVVIVKNCTFDLKELYKYFDSPSADTVLVFTGTLTKNFDEPLKKKKIEVVDCTRLKGDIIHRWIINKCDNLNSEISSDASKKLAEYCSFYLYRIDTELEKLISYAEGRQISVKDVEDMVKPDLEFKLYELGDAVAAKNSKKTTEILDALFAENVSPVTVFSSLYRHFRKLLFVRLDPTSDTIASDLAVSEYAIKAINRQASNYSQVKLKRITDDLHNADFSIKTGKMTDSTALISFVYKTLGT